MSRRPDESFLLWGIGTAIFLLGSPLTLLYAILMPYIGRFLMWSIGNELGILVIPVYILLFVCQWIIWSQLITLAHRKIFKSGKTGQS